MIPSRYARMTDHTVLCRDCSTRTRGVTIPTDEQQLHDDWHTAREHDTCDRDVCAGGHLGCQSPVADHVDEDGVQLHCPFCRRATHYDELVGDYRHCDGSACWQTAADDYRVPTTLAEHEAAMPDCDDPDCEFHHPRCEWFALCDRDATTTVPHPTLGAVPACERCAAKAGA